MKELEMGLFNKTKGVFLLKKCYITRILHFDFFSIYAKMLTGI